MRRPLKLAAVGMVAAFVLCEAAGAAGPAPVVWTKVTIERQHAPVKATLTFERGKASYGAFIFRNMHLVVKDGSATVFNKGLCAQQRCAIASHHSLSLENVWGDGAPEVLLDTYTGGAHCCFETLFVLANGGHAGKAIEHLWGDPGYEVKRLGGKPALLTADDRFAYEFTSFAGSGLPAEVLSFSPSGNLENVTETQPAIIKKDAAQWWKAYTSGRTQPDSDVRGVVAAWCADQVLLGQTAACNAELKTALAKGYLKGPGLWPQNQKFIALLNHDLNRWGYR